MAPIALIWGFAEATLFFVVPDVFLTLVAVSRGARRALSLSVLSALGAVGGGALMMWWGGNDIAAARVAVHFLPAISADMIAGVAAAMQRPDWPLAMLLGAFGGVPYKVFAMEAGAAQLSAAPFLAASFAARLLRFSLAVLAARIAARLLERRLSPRGATYAIAGSWTSFYLLFWSLMPS
ncbi:MAG: hypothetical protein ACHQAY_05890 [Hyphomicrobiales bacterium]